MKIEKIYFEPDNQIAFEMAYAEKVSEILIQLYIVLPYHAMVRDERGRNERSE